MNKETRQGVKLRVKGYTYSYTTSITTTTTTTTTIALPTAPYSVSGRHFEADTRFVFSQCSRPPAAAW
ncbi:hypothetical protein E2C01_059601 [Portunus trituberculatus]|uniref:Uncharacterized protein n=1 Tax=Portunus trituberculatus TaxID=210409 RepID=A0A5B7H885_PORTR|nr:hypothetical protein [Portunus trituberculatus]